MSMCRMAATLLAAMMTLAGCYRIVPPDPPKPYESIVFGYLDTDRIRVPLKWIELQQYEPRVRGTAEDTDVDDGMFFNFYLRPGTYAMHSFGGHNEFDMVEITVSRQSRVTRFRIDRPGIHYVGSYRCVPAHERGLKGSGIVIERTEIPTERELLERLIDVVRGTVMEPRLRERLEGLQ